MQLFAKFKKIMQKEFRATFSKIEGGSFLSYKRL